MGTNAQSLRCSRPECEISTTGICVEGNTPVESCPFFGKDLENSIDNFEEDSFSQEPSAEDDRVQLDLGEALSTEEVDQFLRARDARFITIIGESESGKTTLICSLYEKFSRGHFAGYSFAGSRTLIGFEKKVHHSRINSGKTHPDTQRTSYSDGLKFFHLSLVHPALAGRIELMISDRAGEMYQQARNNSAAVVDLIEVQKAWMVLILMDGNRLATATTRSGAMQSVRQTLQALLDGGALNHTSRVQIITTKIDLLREVKGQEAFKRQMETFCSTLKRDFEPRLGHLTFSEIAARDPAEEISALNGLDDLLKSWCTTDISNPRRSLNKLELKTEFDRLLMRTYMGDAV